MRVGIIIERIETWRGGAETSTLEYAHLLAARGVDVTLLTASRCPSLPDLRVIHVPVGATLKPLRTARFARKAAAAARDAGFDLVHAISPALGADLYQPRGGLMRETIARNRATRPGGSARLLKGLSQAFNVKHRMLLRLEEQILAADGPLIAAVSQYVARQLREHYAVDSQRIRVVFNGVTVAPVAPAERAADRAAIRGEHGLSPDTLALLCVAHNFRLKGVEPLLVAMSRLGPHLARTRLLIAGRDDSAGMVGLARKLGVAERVTFIGPTQRIAAFYHAADVCVHPTFYDPCSRVVLEALSRGLPCITTRHNGASEVMEEGRHGYVIDDASRVDDLADRIVRMHDAARRAEMSRAAALLAPRVSMQRHVDEMMAVYGELCAARAATGRNA